MSVIISYTKLISYSQLLFALELDTQPYRYSVWRKVSLRLWSHLKYIYKHSFWQIQSLVKHCLWSNTVFKARCWLPCTWQIATSRQQSISDWLWQKDILLWMFRRRSAPTFWRPTWRGRRTISPPKCLAQARMGFRIETRMVVCPGNMKGMFRGRMECEACVAWRGQEEEQVVATQQHLTVCPAYVWLRVGKDIEGSFSDLIKYFTDIMKLKSLRV